jgi:hypothetical protein
MGLIRFYGSVLREALRHSLDIAQAAIFFIFLLAGLIAARNPASKPIIESLDLSGWKIAAIVFGSIIFIRLVLAPYWLWRERVRTVDNLQNVLTAIGEDRPLAYYNSLFNFFAPSFQNGKIALTAWGISIENLGDKMLKYEVQDFWLEDAKGSRFIAKPIPDKGGFISAKTKMNYSALSVDDEGMFLGNGVGTQWVIGFRIEYDNVPPLKSRTTEQKIQFTLTSLVPMATGNTILYRDER